MLKILLILAMLLSPATTYAKCYPEESIQFLKHLFGIQLLYRGFTVDENDNLKIFELHIDKNSKLSSIEYTLKKDGEQIGEKCLTFAEADGGGDWNKEILNDLQNLKLGPKV